MKTVKYLNVFLVLALLVLSCASVALADYDIDSVEVDDIDITSHTVSVEAGDSVDLEVTVTSDVDVENARIRAWIPGYEHDDIEDKTSEFDMTADVYYTKDMTLEIPDDLEADDYDVRVEVYDRDGELEVEGIIQVTLAKHKLDVLDVIFDSTPDAGDELDVEVRLENTGSTKEEDIKVTVTAFGDSDTDYLDELVTDESETDDDDEETSGSVDLLLNVPEDASSEYEMEVTVSYDDGREEIVEVYTLTVDGDATVDELADEPVEGQVEMNVYGDGLSYELVFSNEGADRTLSFDVNGVSLWADAEFTTDELALVDGDVETVYLDLFPFDDAAGDYAFTLLVYEGEDVIAEVPLEAEVVEQSVTSNGFIDTVKLLKYGFVALIVLLVLVALIVAFKRRKKDDDDFPLEPKDGQTYY